MLMTVDKLRREFPNCEPVVLREIEREVSEGEGHTGMAFHCSVHCAERGLTTASSRRRR